MSRSVLVVVFVLAGCRQILGFGPLPDKPPGDGDSDGNPDGPPPLCYGSGLVVLCLATAPSQPLLISSAMAVDTDGGGCQTLTSGPNVCVLAGTSIQIDATLSATGGKPLVLVAPGKIEVTGAIDVASHPAMLGAGGNPMACVSPTAATAGSSGGGGAGGSFGGAGGKGGSGDGGVGGVPAGAIVDVTALRGGCRGGDGALATHGVGGSGGGAVYLIGSSIVIGGIINASGTGGTGGTGLQDCGGGGGGSGGMIGLEAPSVIAQSGAQLFANGGGGGEGSSTTSGNPGNDPPTAVVRGLGGAGGSTNGGNGGDGSLGAGGSIGANGNLAGGGNGGGGGGTGVILVVPPQTLGGMLSPAPR